ncbi:MAG: helix-turn-helix domain-containing protein [Candidatus Bathyarchaeia archaeon]
MIIPCEIAVKSVIPAIKALMAKELVEKGLKQDEAAAVLGISQSAVSKYNRKVRGNIIKLDDVKEIEPLIKKMVELLQSKTYQRQQFLEIFCQTCIVIRKTGIVCQFCQKTEPNIKECGFCQTAEVC